MNAKLLNTLVLARDTLRRVFFWLTAILPPYRPKRGITIVAPLRDGASLSKVMRDFAIALKAAGIPYQTFDLCLSKNVKETDTLGALTPWWKFRARRFSHVVEMFDSPFPQFHGLVRSPVIFWESKSGFLEAHPEILPRRDVIAMSDFNVQYFSKALSASVHKIIYPFRMPLADVPPRDEMRRQFGIEANDFAIFFNFDLSSGFGRKNPDGALRAFAKAFPTERNVRLIFKTMHASQHPDIVNELNRLAAELGVGDRFTMVSQYLPHRELYGLTASCDCYLSLHRGEGFGLGMAEAMSLGVPIVATAYSANTEFCNDKNSIPIPYKLLPVPPTHRIGVMSNVTHWAEPDLDAAANALRKLYESLELRKRLSDSGRDFIVSHFSTDNFSKSVEALLVETTNLQSTNPHKQERQLP